MGFMLFLLVQGVSGNRASTQQNKYQIDPCFLAQQEAPGASAVWALGGCAGGFLLGCIGGGAAVALAYSSEPNVPPYAFSRFEDPRDQMLYVQCYRQKAKEAQTRSAIAGAAVGVLLAAYLYYLWLLGG